ncbi:sodium:proton antiporter [Pelagicoccus sp. SDUM812003]|uniref:sodium:proton antiporter n=1 Tax=Pelagicoccus sp. SDUM812003 TaxID=3041267 RepID=UPI00280CE402|nr:sodium:proton antiporter [Pelagicoccus sp. SDUM812003]MDQ8202263.1 sodium:proton antiporter [Pelagicoccus sp. SDUM812003]
MESDIAFRAITLALGVGLLLTVIAHKFDLPTIVLLLAGGLALGPAGLGWIQPESLGHVLPVIVSLSIGIILFEGGLTLKPKDYLASPRIIKRLLTVGVLVTWLCASAAVYLVFQASWQISLLAGSLVIVTGPTVIVPMLHRLRLKSKLGSILHWEGVLIDAVGVFVAVFCYELVVAKGGGSAVGGLLLRLAVGLGLGIAGGVIIQQCLKRAWIPDSLTNPFALAAAVLVFASAEFISHESGLLAVTVAGVIVGQRRSSEVRQIQAFKAELTDILIATLFLLLVSRLDPNLFLQHLWKLVLAVGIVMIVGRPLNIALCSIGSGLTGREKLFLAWVAPRGIVAASMASLFTLQLNQMPQHAAEASIVETFVYTTICATVVIQGLSAGWWARKLGVSRGKADGWLIVGAHALSRAIARIMVDRGRSVVLVDNNQRNIDAAQQLDLHAVLEDAREAESLRDSEHFQDVGRVLALTDNPDLNELIANRWQPFVGRSNLFAWSQRSGTETTESAFAVFNDLPQPSIVSEELNKGKARLKLSMDPISEDEIALMSVNGSALLPLHRKEKPEKDAMVLRLSRQRSSLGRAVERGGVFRIKGAKDLDEVYRQLCDEALSVEPRLDGKALVEELAELARRRSPIFGEDVSAHHLYSAVLERSICLLGWLETPVASRSGRTQVEFVFLIVSPTDDPEEPLSMLSQLVQLCHDHDALEAWASRQSTSATL